MKQENKPSLRFIWGIVMVLFYLCMSILFALTPIFDNIHFILRIIMGALLFVYGLFRGYRMWKGM